MPKTNKPFFSIITCTYNSNDFVSRNIESVRKQDCDSYEHVFIDAYSNDGTTKTINKYKKSNPKQVMIFQSPPKGVANAFNLGVKKAKGKYIIHLNSDDYFIDDKVLTDVHDFLVCNNFPDWIYGVVNILDEKGNVINIMPKYNLFKKPNISLLRYLDYIPHQSVFIKKTVFTKYGLFDESVKYLADYEYWLRISDKTKWIFFNRIVANYTARATSVSLNKKHMHKLKNDTIAFHKRYSSYIQNKVFIALNYGLLTQLYRRWKYYGN